MVRIYCAWLLVICAAAACAAPPASDGDLPARLEAVATHRMRLTRTPGVALALIRDGQVVWTAAFGFADLETRTPLTPGSLFGVASISKTATAWGVMKLVEAGVLDLDAPVGTYLKSWRLPPSEFDLSGVTVRRLLSHSAGLNTPEYLGYLPGTPLPSIRSVLASGDGRAPGVRVTYPPGSGFHYSDGGFLLLQMLIEDVTGEAFETFIQREVLDALGIQNAGFASDPQIAAGLVTSYDAAMNPLPHYRFVESAPAGLVADAASLAQLVAAAMSGPNNEPPGRGVLKPATVAAMLAPQVQITGYERLIYAQGYGLGVYTETLADGRQVISHMGANLNGVTEFAAIPESGDGIVVLTTSMAGHEVFADVLAEWVAAVAPGVAATSITLPRAIIFARAGILALAVVLGAAGAWILAATAFRLHRRRLVPAVPWTGDHRGRRSLVLLAATAGMIVYGLWLADDLRLAMPTAAGWLGAGILLLCVALATCSLTSRNETTALEL